MRHGWHGMWCDHHWSEVHSHLLWLWLHQQLSQHTDHRSEHRRRRHCAIQSTYELLYVHLNLYSYCTTERTSDVSCKLSIITYLPLAACNHTSYRWSASQAAEEATVHWIQGWVLSTASWRIGASSRCIIIIRYHHHHSYSHPNNFGQDLTCIPITLDKNGVALRILNQNITLLLCSVFYHQSAL